MSRRLSCSSASVHRLFVLLAILVPFVLRADAPAGLQVEVRDADGRPLAGTMVRLQPLGQVLPAPDHSGYPEPGVPFTLRPEQTRWTGIDGRVALDWPRDIAQSELRLRRPGYADWTTRVTPGAVLAPVAMRRLTDPQEIAAQLPANVRAHAIRFDDDMQRKRFRMQCGFCHQQGTPAMMFDRPLELWEEITRRMVGYGARLPSEDQKPLPELLAREHARLLADPSAYDEPTPWDPALLAGTTLHEWPMGDIYSQMHDMLVHGNGRVYLGDNINDRLWELDPETDRVVIHRMPHDPGDEIGGLIAARLAAFPKHDDYVALHSLAESHRDGHIFTTPSNVRRIIEFAPDTGAFTVHRFDKGLYPHTIRVDSRDRVWFTLALSNHIGMLDRSTGAFTILDLPARNWREALTLRFVSQLFWLAERGLPLNRFPIDPQNSGVPLPYGIDVSPVDDTVWFTRLHANDIGRIDPDTLEVELIPFPHVGPRRLRVDAEGKVWITAFGDSALVRFDPELRKFTRFDMPTRPLGSDTPYALNVDRARGIVWVNGTASDTMQAFDIASETWSVFPLSRRHSFGREVEFSRDGTAWTANGAFPAWHIEDQVPTLIAVTPPWAGPVTTANDLAE